MPIHSGGSSPTRILVWAQLHCAPDLELARHEVARLTRLGLNQKFDVRIEPNRPWSELATVLREFDPDLFHYIGHGKLGTLIALDVHPDTGCSEQKITPAQLTTAFRARKARLRGLVLNGCDTSHWVPHFIPDGGWVIGATRKVGDDPATLFADQFYTNIEAGLSDKQAFDYAMKFVTELDNGQRPPIVQWIADPDPTDFLRQVFDRQAFCMPARAEASLFDLHDALVGVKNALRTRTLATRTNIDDQGVVFCRDPLDAAMVRALRARLDIAQGDLRRLNREFPDVVRFGGGGLGDRAHEEQYFLFLADRVDASRNQLLVIANDYLPSEHQFPMIELSSRL